MGGDVENVVVLFELGFELGGCGLLVEAEGAGVESFGVGGGADDRVEFGFDVGEGGESVEGVGDAYAEDGGIFWEAIGDIGESGVEDVAGGIAFD